jgi:uncharacterized damage-inducible protein DinB
MYHHINDFVQDWQSESANTLKVMQQLSDASLQQRVTDKGRSLGRIAWHIVQSFSDMAGRMGIQLDAPKEEAPIPQQAQLIAQSYAAAANSIGKAVQAWSDADLQVEDNMYGEMWKRGVTLQILIQHEIHHRGQMTVLMRQAGLSVPGVCGPSAEEWSQFGMPAQE